MLNNFIKPSNMKNRLVYLIIFALCFVQNLIADSSWIVKTDKMSNDYVGIPIANGRIGILPWQEPFSVRHVVLNHVFDESQNPTERVSQVLLGLNPFCLSMCVDGEIVNANNVNEWAQELNMREATHLSRFTVAEKAEVEYTICALRNMPYAGMIRMRLKALKDTEINLVNSISVPEQYKVSTPHCNRIHIHGSYVPVLRKSASSLYRDVTVSASSAYIYDRNDKRFSLDCGTENNTLEINLKEGEMAEVFLVGSICSERDFIDPKNESDRQVVFALMEGAEKLFAAHRKAWDDLWKGDVIIEGDEEAQHMVRLALYSLYSFARAGSGLSVSPMGLSARGYNGHIFWDTEIWMFPPMLLMNQGIARSMMDYRTDRLQAACDKADAYGFEGAMFPWESDDAGEESCPTWALTGPLQHHITADIAIAAWNYYCVTRDAGWLREEGYPLIKEAADFWTSRVTKNDDGSYSILNVVCADEYAEGVDDNAYTNGAVIRALQAATKAAKACGLPANPTWESIASGLRILAFEDDITREHATYDGRMIRQADANLLGYPLGLITDKNRLKRDLEYYLERIDKENGPAMSYAVFAVQYARLGDADKAYRMFQRSYRPNIRAPFGVMAETATSMNPYFATGAGGLLQSVICGFAGLEITDEGIRQVPSVLPKHWKKLTVTGVGPEGKTYVKEK